MEPINNNNSPTTPRSPAKSPGSRSQQQVSWDNKSGQLGQQQQQVNNPSTESTAHRSPITRPAYRHHHCIASSSSHTSATNNQLSPIIARPSSSSNHPRSPHHPSSDIVTPSSPASRRHPLTKTFTTYHRPTHHHRPATHRTRSRQRVDNHRVNNIAGSFVAIIIARSSPITSPIITPVSHRQVDTDNNNNNWVQPMEHQSPSQPNQPLINHHQIAYRTTCAVVTKLDNNNRQEHTTSSPTIAGLDQ